MEVESLNNVDIGANSFDNHLITNMIDGIVQNLIRCGKRYEMTISGSTSGKDNINLYYENLDSVIESVFATVSKSDLGMYKGDVYFFTGKIYERVPSHSHLSWALRTYLRVSGVPKAFIVRSMKSILSVMYKSLEINRVLSPRYNIMAFENGVVDMKDGNRGNFRFVGDYSSPLFRADSFTRMIFNIFRILGDLCHLLSFIVLIVKIKQTKSCYGERKRFANHM